MFYIDKLDNGIIVGHNGGSFHFTLEFYSYKNGNLEFQKKSVVIFPKEYIHLNSLYGINKNEIIIVYHYDGWFNRQKNYLAFYDVKENKIIKYFKIDDSIYYNSYFMICYLIESPFDSLKFKYTYY